MKKNESFALNASIVQSRLGLCAAALAGTAAAVPSVQATVITNNVNAVVPATFAGIYLNFVTGQVGTSGGGTPGFDFNPYLSGANLAFYWGPAASGNGGVASGGVYSNLTFGSVVSAASTFQSTPGAGANFLSAGTHILGFRFLNEATSATNFGYLTISNGGATGFPATVLSYSYENNGGGITVVPEPETTALLTIAALALGGVGLRQWRRQQAA